MKLYYLIDRQYVDNLYRYLFSKYLSFAEYDLIYFNFYEIFVLKK